MPIDTAGKKKMPLAARRVYRLGLTMALSLVVAYGLPADLPFFAPLFALLLTAAPGPPLRPKALAGLILLVLLTLGIGLLMIPVLLNYPVTAVLLVAIGLYLSNYLTVNLGKNLIGVLLTMGITMISAAGTLSYALATTVVSALVTGIGIAVLCNWVVYPWFPENRAETPRPAPEPQPARDNWIALRATLIVMPAYLLALTNPSAYLPIIIKSVSLAQQSSMVDTRHAGRELLGSTFAGGCLAIVFWFALGLAVELWMFFLWMLLFGLLLGSRLHGLAGSRFPASFWQNAGATMIILLGSAVQDSANGKDVYQAFAVRMALFVAVTAYAWVAVAGLERLRNRSAAAQEASNARPRIFHRSMKESSGRLTTSYFLAQPSSQDILKRSHQGRGGYADHHDAVDRFERTQQPALLTHYHIAIAECGEVHRRVIEGLDETRELTELYEYERPNSYLQKIPEQEQHHHDTDQCKTRDD